MKRTVTILALVCCFAAACSTAPDERSYVSQELRSASDGNERAGDPVINPEALLRPGDIGGGEFVLSNGRRVTPAGTYVQTASFPMDVAVSPDGETAVVVSAKRKRLTIIDVESASITQEFALPGGFSGAVFNAAGDRFWVSGGSAHVVLEYSLSAGVAAENARISVSNMPSGMTLSSDESRLYVACYLGKRVAVINTATGEEIDSIPAHLFSYDVRLSNDGQTAFVSNHGPGTVTAHDLTDDGREIAEMTVGTNPEMMALSPDGARLYVANSDSDDVSVIDTEALEVIDTFELSSSPAEPLGASPVAVEVTQDGSRLYVTSSTYNSIDVLDAENGDMLGRIPAGWYPTNAVLDEAHGRLFFTNGKGRGSAGRGLYDGSQGGLSIADIPDDTDLLNYWDQVEDNVTWSTRFFDLTGAESPIPFDVGTPSEQIKHVVYVLRENKTFDQVFGTMVGVEADPDLANFDESLIPNAFALARAFSVSDNTYTEGDTSVLGHLWATYGNVNDHAEKAYSAGGIYPLPDVDPNTRPQSPTIFDLLLDNGVPFRSYGQIVGLAHNIEKFAPYMDFKYGFWNMGVSDEVKVDEIIREVEAGIFEPFTYISLPNDHTYGSKTGAPTVDYLMGDNDAALGKLVEYYSHRPEWESTVIFVIEDDPQSGTDHIDPHRTPTLVIGPHVRHGYISQVLYSMPSLWATITRILGVPPMNQYDAYSSPMFDMFTMTPDLTSYTGIPNPTPFQLGAKGLPMQAYCDEADWSTPDAVERLGEVIWALKKPGVPWPYDYAMSHEEEEDEEEEDEREVAAYHEAMDAILSYASSHGIEVPPQQPASTFIRPRR